jgi:hypothetical protein
MAGLARPDPHTQEKAEKVKMMGLGAVSSDHRRQRAKRRWDWVRASRPLPHKRRQRAR